MVQETTRDHVYRNWAERLECDISDMKTPKLIVRQHSGKLEGYHGIYCFYNGSTCVISAPPKYVPQINIAVSGCRPDEAFDVKLLARSLNSDNYQVIGPAFQGYVDCGSFIELKSPEVVELVTEKSLVLLQDLRKSCSETEWEHSNIEDHRQPIIARFYDEKIVAAGSWSVERSGFLSVGIISHPDYRGNGHAKAVVSALTSKGLTTGAIMHYQTLKSNTSSVAIAHSLGYKELACTLAIKFSNLSLLK
ncbi:GNAT family N-acetyltransferase [Fictibacillus sp. b24]|uniref:GNAT family N-acetyltransferase n=1 Tax=Fictibacillus sp. b24 TaxID=3055863 RepID=UPI0025A001BC|nr:GNAT family N-acetyltransferase [Fictibacillus sp. b24]MDM5317169.1 GNAT family N-acetyltransferase [Fictibacillus sp. b24]